MITTLHLRIDTEVKNHAEQIAIDSGSSLHTVINEILERLIREKSVTFSL